MNPYQSETGGWKMSFCILLVSFCCVWSVQEQICDFVPLFSQVNFT